MKKVYYLSAALAMALASCKTTQKTSCCATACESKTTKLGIADKELLTMPSYFASKKTALPEEQLQRWSHLDLHRDSVPGMSVDRAYDELIKGKKGSKVVVAVIDSGIDIHHEDLNYTIWTNKKEIPGNGIDDDNNGYIDDVHGWNPLGGTNEENMEFTRILKKGDDGTAQYQRAVKKMEEEKANLVPLRMRANQFRNSYELLVKATGKKDFVLADLEKVNASTDELKEAKTLFERLFKNGRDVSIVEAIEKQADMYSKYYLKLDFNGRKSNDNVEDIRDKYYGDGDVYGEPEHALHGTHVAGIIAQKRGNDKGGDGVINDNVEIMSLRAVPDGDEYDKDIALAIRYAVDNGAKVINGSFGKYFETHAEWVYDAIEYAAVNDVLLVMAAGNDALDLNGEETIDRFPNDRNILTKINIAPNFILVGALNPKYGEGMVANFSNFGNVDVDVFAPGVKIYATAPEGEYKYLQGTSMASPNATGVAAMIRSYYPTLKAWEVKEIMKESGIAIDGKVIVSGDKNDKRNFKDISTSGTIVNLYNALILAERRVNAKK